MKVFGWSCDVTGSCFQMLDTVLLLLLLTSYGCPQSGFELQICSIFLVASPGRQTSCTKDSGAPFSWYFEKLGPRNPS